MAGERLVTAGSRVRGAAIVRVLAIARERFGMDVATICSVGPGAERFLWTDGDIAGFGVQAHLPATPLGAVARRIAEGRFPLLVTDAADVTERATLQIAGVASYLAVPVVLRGEPGAGVMLLAGHLDDPKLDDGSIAELTVLGRAVTKLVDEEPSVINEASVARIQNVIDHDEIAMVFQPIVDVVHGWTVGYEALARFGQEPDRAPDRWFAEAVKVDRGLQLELTAARAALRRVHELPTGAFLAINVSPALISSGMFEDLLVGVDGRQIVIELTSHASIEDPVPFNAVMDRLHASGVRLAVDDAGGGYSSLSSILQLAPDIIKVDPIIVRDIDSDPVRRALVAGLVAFAKDIDATTTAEGVETLPEAVTLRALGVDHAQGHHYAAPGALGT